MDIAREFGPPKVLSIPHILTIPAPGSYRCCPKKKNSIWDFAR